MTLQCSEPQCSASAQIQSLTANDAEQSRKIDKILSILTDSTLDGGSVVDRLRKHEAQINELKSVPPPAPPSLLQLIIRKGVETLTTFVVGGSLLFLTRGIVAEILSKGQP